MEDPNFLVQDKPNLHFQKKVKFSKHVALFIYICHVYQKMQMQTAVIVISRLKYSTHRLYDSQFIITQCHLRGHRQCHLRSILRIEYVKGQMCR